MYLELIKEFPLRLLESEKDLDAAIAMLNKLLDRNNLDFYEMIYLEILGDIINKYEKEYYPRKHLGNIDVLKHLIESRNITQTQLAKDTDIAESTISAILLGKRRMNRDHINVLSKYFKIMPDVFYE